MSKANDVTPRGDILETLKNIRGGDCVYELTQELEKVVDAVRDTRKKGIVKLEIAVQPLHKDDEYQMLLLDKIDSTVPRHDKAPTIMFANKQNVLSRNDPRQGDFADVEESFRATGRE